MTLDEQGPSVARGVSHPAETPWPDAGSTSAVGAPGRNRTCDLEIRRLLLYPSELRGHVPAASAGNARIVGEHAAYPREVSSVGLIRPSVVTDVPAPGSTAGSRQGRLEACDDRG